MATTRVIVPHFYLSIIYIYIPLRVFLMFFFKKIPKQPFKRSVSFCSTFLFFLFLKLGFRRFLKKNTPRKRRSRMRDRPVGFEKKQIRRKLRRVRHNQTCSESEKTGWPERFRPVDLWTCTGGSIDGGGLSCIIPVRVTKKWFFEPWSFLGSVSYPRRIC